jgi:magnesium transporter
VEPLVVTGQGAIILAREVRMEIQVLKDGTSQVCSVDALPDALRDPESLVWVDIITCDAQALALLREVFGFHPVAIRECP